MKIYSLNNEFKICNNDVVDNKHNPIVSGEF